MGVTCQTVQVSRNRSQEKPARLRAAPRNVLRESNTQFQGSKTTTTTTAVTDPSSMDTESLVTYINKQITELSDIHVSKVSKSPCTKCFEVLYAQGSMPLHRILNLHTKYLLKLVDFSASGMAQELYNAFNALCGANPAKLSDLLCITAESLKPGSSLVNHNIKSGIAVDPSWTQLARAIVSFQSLVMKYLIKNPSLIKKVGESNLAKAFVATTSSSSSSGGSPVYWSSFLPINEKLNRLNTLSKFAYQFSVLVQTVKLDLLFASARLCVFPANTKALHDYLIRTAHSQKVLSTRFASEAQEILQNIPLSNVLTKDLKPICTTSTFPKPVRCSDSSRKKLADEFQKLLDAQNYKPIRAFLETNFDMETSIMCVYDALVVLSGHLNINAHSHWAGNYMEIAGYFSVMLEQSQNWPLITFTCEFMAKYLSQNNSSASSYLKELIHLDRVAFYGSNKTISSKDMLQRTKRLLSLVVKSQTKDPNELMTYLKFAFDLLETEYSLNSLSQSNSLEQLLAIPTVEDVILIAAQSMVYSGVDLTSGDEQSLSVVIFELILSVLWRSSSKAKIPICDRLLERILAELATDEHPVRVCQAVYSYYNSTGGCLPKNDIFPKDSEFSRELVELLDGGSLGLDEGLRHLSYLLKAFLSITVCIEGATSYRSSYELATRCLIDYFGSAGGKISHQSLEKQIDMFLSQLGALNVYDLQISLLTAISKSNNCPIKYEVGLAEAYLAVGKTHKCHEIVLRLQKSVSRNSLTAAKLSLINADACIADYQIELAETSILDCEKLLNDPGLSGKGVIKSLKEVRDNKNTFNDLHPQVLLLCRYLLAKCDLAATKLRKEDAIKTSNGVMRFAASYLKSIQSRDQLKNAVDLAPIVTLLVRAATKSARIYETLGVISATLYRFNLISKLVSCGGDDSWSSIGFKWSAALQLETLIRRGRHEEASNLLCEVKTLFSKLTGNYDLTSMQRRYAYTMVEYASGSEAVDLNDAETGLEQMMQDMALEDDVSGSTVRYKIRDVLVRIDYYIGKSDYKVAKSCVDYARKLCTSQGNLHSPEMLTLEMLDVKIKYKESLKMVNEDPVYAEIYKGSVFMIPFAKKPLSKQFKAVTILREAESQLAKVRDDILNNCGITVLQQLVTLQTEIEFLLNAFSYHEDTVSSYYLPQVIRDLPYSIRSGRCLEYSEAQLHSNVVSSLEDEKLTLQELHHENFDRTLLPDDWIVVSLQYTPESKALVATRFTKNEEPISLRIPSFIDRFTDDEGDCFTFAEAKEMIQDIVLRSSYKVTDPANITEEDKQKWWTSKFDGDKELCELIKKAAYSWFGGFKAIFGNPSIQLPQGFYDSIDDVFQKYLRGRLGATKRARPNNRKGHHVELDPMVYRLFALAMTVNSEGTKYFEDEWEDDDRLIEDLVNLVLDLLFLQGEKNPYDEIDIDHLVVEIEEVVSRYVGVNLEPAKHTVLVVDKECHDFPWESLPFLINREVTRVPSLGLLNRLLERNPTHRLQLEKAFYVLNPGNDLKATEERMNKELATMDHSLCEWTGYSGVLPEDQDLVHSLENDCDLYVYMGHGGGRNYIRRSDIEGLHNCPPTMLFGCRSCETESEGVYESSGHPLSYLAAGCPMLLCSLFNVTDKDTDLHTARILRSWTDKSTDITVTRALNESRKDMKLPYLNGAAFVIYGLPLIATSAAADTENHVH